MSELDEIIASNAIVKQMDALQSNDVSRTATAYQLNTI